jgi:glycosyltransferase involved in cell wall biosynthesis
MSASIVTFANLGEKKNLKTADIASVIDSFSGNDELKQVICQINKNFYFQNTNSAVPLIIRYAIRILEKFFYITLSREDGERIFDFFASLKLKKADVVFFHPALFVRTLRIAKGLGCSTVGIASVAHPLFAKKLYEEESLKLGLRKRMYSESTKSKLIVNKFDYIIALSEFVKRSCVEYGFPSEKIFVANLDVDTVRFSPKNEDNKVFKVVYTAYTTPLKGLHYLLDAWTALSLPDAELILIGGYGDIPKTLISQYDILIEKDSSIKWIGPSDTPEQYYHDASIFAFPSLTEGFPRVVLEAMACGLPIITTENAAGIVEDGVSGFVVPIRNADMLGKKIQFLYDNPEKRIEMGKAAREAVGNKKPFGEAVLEIYREIMIREQRV